MTHFCHDFRIFFFSETVLQDMEDSVRHSEPVEILSSCSKSITEINEMLLSSNSHVSMTAFRIILFLGNYTVRTSESLGYRLIF